MNPVATTANGRLALVVWEDVLWGLPAIRISAPLPSLLSASCRAPTSAGSWHLVPETRFVAGTWLAAGWPSRLAALFPFPSIKEGKADKKGLEERGFQGAMRKQS